MQEIIRVDNQPAEVFVNFDEVEAQLQQHLEHYERHVVTVDTVKHARELAAELNKLKTEINRRRKDEIDRASVHIRTFDQQMKKLIEKTDQARSTITSQISKFDEETKRKARESLEAYRTALWARQNVEREYRSAEIDDLVKVSALTKAGKLTKSVATEVENRVHADAAEQHRIQLRVAQLAERSVDAGLKTPLTRDNVEHFLSADDDTYERELQRRLDAELEREAKAARIEREKAKREAQAKAEADQREAERQQRAQETTAPAPEPEQGETDDQGAPWDRDAEERHSAPAVAPAADGKEVWQVVMTFEVQVPAGTTAEQIRNGARGIVDPRAAKTLKHVKAQRLSTEAAA